MTLIVAALVPEGIALSGDGRAMLEEWGDEQRTKRITRKVHKDDAIKIHQLDEHIGAAAYGEFLVDNIEVGEHLNKVIGLSTDPTSGVRQLSQAVRDHFHRLASRAPGFLLAGYEGNAPLLLRIDPSGNVHQLFGMQQGRGLVCGFIVEGDLPAAQWLREDPGVDRDWPSTTLEEALVFTQTVIQQTIERTRCDLELSSVGGLIRSLVVTPVGCNIIP